MARTRGVWVILLTYRVGDVLKVGPIARPTQLDAGWDHRHFPSPVCSGSGHPMDLKLHRNRKNGPLIPEYLHQQIPYDFSQWGSLHGGLVDCTRGKVWGTIRGQRRAHHKRLALQYGQKTVEEMMPDSLPPP